MKTLASIFLVSVCALALSSCKEDNNDPQPSKEDISLEPVVNDVNDNPIEVKLTFESITIEESGDKKYYSFDYKIEVKNTGSTKLAFTNNIVQAYIIDGVQSYAAAGKKVDDFELEPGSTFVISYVANAAQLQPDGLDLDGMTLQINLYQNNDSDDLIARLEYLISIDK